ncbi:E3 ubiquitin-protein ligase [Venturia nashicola]|uniref:E3 ubiquitin-protein ligase n=1 Tax=Venturia nashicola TaxID=86259 RepID=A0A4Z1P495_9PEZI|nr:E3 ubiquitin-protein ligase [Venturia nashicola]
MDPATTEQPSNTPNAESDTSVDVPPPPPSSDDVKEQQRITTPGEPTQSLQSTASNLTDQALQFLSTASNETLGACLVGIGATTYFVLGRVGLVLIGVVGGVVLHATWEGGSSEGNAERNVEERRRKEIGVEVVKRALEWRRGKGEKEADGEEKVAVVGKRLGFEGFRPETEGALNELTEAVIRDYVKWWYSPVIPGEEAFPAASRQTLVAFLLSVSSHLSRKRPADTFLEFLTNSSSIMIVFLGELSSAMSASPNTAATEAIETYLNINPESHLASILDQNHQAKKLDLVAEDILQCYLEPKSYNAEVIRTFCQQVLAKLVIEMTIQSCSRPEFINGWIVYLLEDGETELMEEIDAGLEGMNASASKTATTIPAEPGSPDLVRTESEIAIQREHKRVTSRAQDAMEEAMQEAQRLSQLIAEEDARRLRDVAASSSEESTKGPTTELLIKDDPFTESNRTISSSSILTDASESTTQGVATPTSSQSDSHAQDEPRQSHDQAVDEKFGAQLEPINSAPFTSFDQLVPQKPVTALSDAQKAKKEIPPLTLHNATISIFDDTDPSERSSLRQKPITDYLIQIEPPSAHNPGWMIVRKYADFETLHEVLRRIAAISGAGVFTQAHAALPGWKNHTKASLREALERYLTDAVRFQSLAESEGMKRFLEKERGMEKSPTTKDSGFGWPTPNAFENMGKGMMDALTKAPKGVAGGGKAFIGGVSGVLGGKKKTNSISPSPAVGRSSTSLPRELGKPESNMSQTSLPRKSQDSLRNMSLIVDTQPALVPQMERKPSIPVDAELPRRSASKPGSKASSTRGSMDMMPILGGDQILHLPPPPSDITDDYSFEPDPIKSRMSTQTSETEPAVRTSTSTAASPFVDRSSSEKTPEKASELPTRPPKPTSAKPPITEQETQMTVELLFAIINELYTLSNAWGLRRTLLTAAKTFLLRPGNPQLESIRQLLQTTVLDDNTSDAGIAMHIRKLRENALPTEEELKTWPAEITKDEKEELRRKARKLLVERGMPQALTSVMGQAASGEALGKVFDCLQVQKVARGLVFGLMLQGIRAVTQ